MQRSGLRFDSDVRAANAPILQQASRNELCRVDPNRKAQSLRAHDGRSVYANYVPIRRDKRPTGVARIQRSIGLDNVVNQSSGVRT